MKLAFVSSIFAAASGLCDNGGLVDKVQTQIQDELGTEYKKSYNKKKGFSVVFNSYSIVLRPKGHTFSVETKIQLEVNNISFLFYF